MIKKMWAILDKENNSCLSCYRYKPEVSIVFDEDDKIKRKMLGCGNDFYDYNFVYIKPVWVTDRDPFENVREHFHKNYGYKPRLKMYIDLLDMLKKDIKNWDSGEGAG